MKLQVVVESAHHLSDAVRLIVMESVEHGRQVVDIMEVNTKHAAREFALRIEDDDFTGAEIEWPDVNFGRAKSVLGKMRKLVERVTS